MLVRNHDGIVQKYEPGGQVSVLLLPIFGFLPFDDERVKSTMDVIQHILIPPRVIPTGSVPIARQCRNWPPQLPG